MRSVISYLIKPVSSLCNMRCHYCFYEDVSSLREVKSYGVMTKDTSYNLIHTTFKNLSANGVVYFAFQGGEPTLWGYDNYFYFVSEVNKTKKKGQKVFFSIQTNLYDTDDRLLDLFKENDFLMGISIDGTRSNHNKYRVDTNQEGTYEIVKENLKKLRERGIEYNALSVVTNTLNPAASYNNLRDLGFQYLQYIPCLDPYEEDRGNRDYSLTPERYGDFLCTLFDLWYEDWAHGDYVSVRLFEDYVHILMQTGPSSCAASGRCGGYYVVEADGSVFPCDFYVMDEWKLGNVNEAFSFDESFTSGKGKEFISHGVPEACKDCQYVLLCNGGCRRDKDYHGEIKENYYCSSFKTFFSYAISRLGEIAIREKEYMVSHQD